MQLPVLVPDTCHETGVKLGGQQAQLVSIPADRSVGICGLHRKPFQSVEPTLSSAFLEL